MEIEISVGGIVAEESSLLKCFVEYDVWSDGDRAECFVTMGEIYWLWKIGSRIWYISSEIVIIEKNIVLLLGMSMEEILLLGTNMNTNIVLGVINYQ